MPGQHGCGRHATDVPVFYLPATPAEVSFTPSARSGTTESPPAHLIFCAPTRLAFAGQIIIAPIENPCRQKATSFNAPAWRYLGACSTICRSRSSSFTPAFRLKGDLAISWPALSVPVVSSDITGPVTSDVRLRDTLMLIMPLDQHILRRNRRVKQGHKQEMRYRSLICKSLDE